MEKIETLGRRLLQVMEERGLNYDRLGKLLDMKPQTLNRYVLGQREPKARVATEMAMKLEVDPLWLQGYDVPKTQSIDPLSQPGETLLPVLGTIRAGIPTLAQQEILGYMAADVPQREGYFYLEVRGGQHVQRRYSVWGPGAHPPAGRRPGRADRSLSRGRGGRHPETLPPPGGLGHPPAGEPPLRPPHRAGLRLRHGGGPHHRRGRASDAGFGFWVSRCKAKKRNRPSSKRGGYFS